MTKIIKTFAFIAVLAGLLTWGVATMAKSPTVATPNVTTLQGTTLENGTDADPHNFKVVDNR